MTSTSPKTSSSSSSINKPRLSPMVENMAISKTIEIHALTKEMERSGKTVYSLCVGEPDYQPPNEVIIATADAANKGLTKYTAVTGELSLRKAIADDLTKRKGTPYTPEQIVVSNGAKQAVIQALMCVACPGDDVLIPSPYWPSYPDMVKMCNARPVSVRTSAKDGYILTPESLRQALQSNPKASCIILCNPSNPTGGVADLENLRGLASVLRDYPQVTVISDEIYERLTYDVPHVSFASLPDMIQRTITINGFSKSHSMTGYRIGYSASSTPIAQAIAKVQSQMTSCASSVGQDAAKVALMEVKETWMSDRVKELKEKRDLAYSLLMKIPNITCPCPDGAFYLLPDVSKYYNKKTPDGKIISNSHELCFELLRSQGVALVSGDAFGCDECIRLSYAASKELINDSVSRLGIFLTSLQ